MKSTVRKYFMVGAKSTPWASFEIIARWFKIRKRVQFGGSVYRKERPEAEYRKNIKNKRQNYTFLASKVVIFIALFFHSYLEHCALYLCSKTTNKTIFYALLNAIIIFEIVNVSEFKIHSFFSFDVHQIKDLLSQKSWCFVALKNNNLIFTTMMNFLWNKF